MLKLSRGFQRPTASKSLPLTGWPRPAPGVTLPHSGQNWPRHEGPHVAHGVHRPRRSLPAPRRLVARNAVPRPLRREVLPRREEVLGIAREIEGLIDASMGDQRAQVALREQELRQNLNRILVGSLGVGAL